MHAVHADASANPNRHEQSNLFQEIAQNLLRRIQAIKAQ